MELQQRVIHLQRLSALAPTSTADEESTSRSPTIRESAEAPSNIEYMVRTEFKRLRDLLRERDDSVQMLTRQRDQILADLEEERKRKMDTRHERLYQAAVTDLKSCMEAGERMRAEFDALLKGKHTEVEDIRRAVAEANEKFEAHVQTLEKDVKRLRKERDSSRDSYELLNGQCASQNKTIEELKRTLQGLKTENEHLRKGANANEELTTLYEAFEGLECQISELIAQAASKGDEANRAKNDRLKMEFEHAQVARQLELANAKMKTGLNASAAGLQSALEREAKLNERIRALEEKILAATMPAKKPIPSLHDANVPDPATAAAGRESGASELKSVTVENQNLKRELAATREQLDAIFLGGGVNVHDLKEQVDLYRRLLKCNTCKTRDKNAVITKCMHVFCRECLETRIETRQRKCPNCGEPFGASDIKNIFL